jgi:ABC-type glutathione transport system ATPase component
MAGLLSRRATRASSEKCRGQPIRSGSAVLEEGIAAGREGKPSSERIIRLRDVTKVYKTGEGGFTAINSINLDIHRGEFHGITGKSGAGKTTLLNLISGVSEISAGEVPFYTHDSSVQAEQRKIMPVHGMDKKPDGRVARQVPGDCVPVL